MDDNNLQNNPEQPTEATQPYTQPAESQSTVTDNSQVNPSEETAGPSVTDTPTVTENPTSSFTEPPVQPAVESPSVAPTETQSVTPGAPAGKKNHRLLFLTLALVVVIAVMVYVVLILK